MLCCAQKASGSKASQASAMQLLNGYGTILSSRCWPLEVPAQHTDHASECANCAHQRKDHACQLPLPPARNKWRAKTGRKCMQMWKRRPAGEPAARFQLPAPNMAKMLKSESISREDIEEDMITCMIIVIGGGDDDDDDDDDDDGGGGGGEEHRCRQSNAANEKR